MPQTHWHITPGTRHAVLVTGPVDPEGCCKGFLSWEDVFGPTPPNPMSEE